MPARLIEASELDVVWASIGDRDQVLDVGGWARPLLRADWQIDLLPYETRGLFGSFGPGPERFTHDTWVVKDICHHEPWPFEDGQFDFVFCSHTLEDVRDPIWVCREMIRVGKRGYIETPSWAEELCRGVESRYWTGHSHHRWLVRWTDDVLSFAVKPHFVHHPMRFHIPSNLYRRDDVDLALRLLWQGVFSFKESIDFDFVQTQQRIQAFVDSVSVGGPRTWLMRVRNMLSRGLGR